MTEPNFLTSILGLALSFTFALILAGLFSLFGRKDLNIYKKRAAHSNPTSRLGGLAVCSSIVAVIATNYEIWNFNVAISALPIFFPGLMEDLGRSIRPKLRIAAGALSAAIFVFLEGYYIKDVGIEWLNFVLSVTPIAIAFTVFCVVALINAMNFIDGINGLASGKALIASFALMYLSNVYNEPNLTLLGTAIFTASLGLFMVNYPQGRIFLGDAGAYTLGFLLATSLITLQNKHSEISAWSILLIIFWPISDMAHSIFRRWIRRQRSDRPDALHLHHVIMRSLVISSCGRISKQWANPLATAIILPMAALPVALGVVYTQSDDLCMILFLVFALLFACAHSYITNATRRRIFLVRRPKKNSFTETN